MPWPKRGGGKPPRTRKRHWRHKWIFIRNEGAWDLYRCAYDSSEGVYVKKGTKP
jgi:hypothetical protein